jgi:phosphatidylglycerol---prolipoprotein diacylglyceryl transferase
MIHWNIDPILFTAGPFTVRWYGLFFALSFFLGHKLTVKLFGADGYGPEYVDRVFIYVLVATLVGARLGHTLFYEPDVYLRDPIRILKVWEGGLASHGAALGILFATWLYSRHEKLPYLWVLDRIVLSIALAGGFIRLGNLFNSEIIGRPALLPWSFIFDRVDQIPRHPTQIYESLTYFCIFFFLYFLFWKEKLRARVGFLFGVFLIGIFGSRIFLEMLKENQVAFESHLPLNLGQILSIPFVLAGIYLVISRLRSSAPELIKASASSASKPVKKHRS